MCCIETMALTEKQQKVHVRESNCIRRIVGVTADERNVDELRLEVGVKESLKETGNE